MHLHCSRQYTFVYTALSAPGTAPSQIQYDIEWCIEWPCILTCSVVLISKNRRTIHIESHGFRCPHQCILMELGYTDAFVSTLDRRSSIIILITMDGRICDIGYISHCLHNIDFAISRPCGEIDRHHPESRPCTLALRQFDTSLYISIFPSCMFFGIDSTRIDLSVYLLCDDFQCTIRYTYNILTVVATCYIVLQFIIHPTRILHFVSPIGPRFRSSFKLVMPCQRISRRSFYRIRSYNLFSSSLSNRYLSPCFSTHHRNRCGTLCCKCISSSSYSERNIFFHRTGRLYSYSILVWISRR